MRESIVTAKLTPQAEPYKYRKTMIGLVYCCLTALSAQAGYIMPQKYNVYHVGQGNNTTIQLNSKTIE